MRPPTFSEDARWTSRHFPVDLLLVATTPATMTAAVVSSTNNFIIGAFPRRVDTDR